MELETASKYRMPIIVIVYNNNAWGTWSGNRRNPLTSSMHLFQENIHYDKLRRSPGSPRRVRDPAGDFRARWNGAIRSRSKAGHRSSTARRKGILDQGTVPTWIPRHGRARLHVLQSLTSQWPKAH
ncbi:MAG: hypothetical protein IPJ07_09010 [Acidobacteria bacterium]|nr:hypothetical protein [Acidobacteriota bacterium]